MPVPTQGNTMLTRPCPEHIKQFFRPNRHLCHTATQQLTQDRHQSWAIVNLLIKHLFSTKFVVFPN